MIYREPLVQSVRSYEGPSIPGGGCLEKSGHLDETLLFKREKSKHGINFTLKYTKEE